MPATVTTPLRHICLIEDHQDYRRVLQKAINSSDHLKCVHAFSSIEAFLEGTAPDGSVDIVLLDLGLPGMHGVEGITLIQERFPSAKILVLTVFDHKPVVLQALAAGASGYLLKADRLETIIKGIDDALQGGAPLNSHIARIMLTTFHAARPTTQDIDLTERERETLALLAKGMTKRQIAEELGLSYHTVDTHVRNIYIKLKVRNLTGAVTRAIQFGLT